MADLGLPYSHKSLNFLYLMIILKKSAQLCGPKWLNNVRKKLFQLNAYGFNAHLNVGYVCDFPLPLICFASEKLMYSKFPGPQFLQYKRAAVDLWRGQKNRLARHSCVIDNL